MSVRKLSTSRLTERKHTASVVSDVNKRNLHLIQHAKISRTRDAHSARKGIPRLSC